MLPGVALRLHRRRLNSLESRRSTINTCAHCFTSAICILHPERRELLWLVAGAGAFFLCAVFRVLLQCDPESERLEHVISFSRPNRLAA